LATTTISDEAQLSSIGVSRIMGFKRSVWWGLGGAVVVSVAGYFVLYWSSALSDASTHLFLSLGLNPREQGLLCMLLFVGFTSVIGFIAGRGVQIRRPST